MNMWKNKTVFDVIKVKRREGTAEEQKTVIVIV